MEKGKAKLKIDMALCSGCEVCELICGLANHRENNLKKAHLKITGQFPNPGGYKVKFSGCTRCGECAKICPTGAITLKEPMTENSTVPKTATAEEKPSGKMGGYAGKILFVNLSDGICFTRTLYPEMARDYLGGRGLAAYLLYRLNPQGVNPLEPDNRVVVASGPLAGTLVPAGGKITFASKSPLTNGYGDSNMGGHLAGELKYAGYDAVVIRGKAEKPSILVIDDDKVEIRDGSKYWGQGSLNAERMLKDDLGEDFQIAVIGPAGENLVRFACVSHDFGRQAGRTGIGAVLGSKNLKAICARGSQSVPLHDFDEVVKKGKEMFKECAENPASRAWQRLGTPGVTRWVNEIGAFPTRNFKKEWFDKHENLSGDVMRERIVIHDKACGFCPMPCGKWSRARKEGKYDVFVEGPEYETIALCGGNTELDNIEDVAYANYLLDQLGLDTISGGAVIAFAMECFEKGVITREMTEGQELKFGDIDSLKWLAEKISHQEGIGAVLALGTKKAAEILGGGSEKFAIQVKGNEQSGYGTRNAPAMMLAYITCDVGAHHNRAWAITWDIEKGRDLMEGKAERVIYLQRVRPMFDMLGVCRLQWVEIGLELEHYPEILKRVTGRDYSLDDLLKISERIWNLTRAFWKRENPGFGRKDDQPPARFLEEEIPDGPSAGKKFTQEKIDELLDEYYRLRGWDQNGIPTKEKLLELGLDFAADELYPES